MFQIWLFRILGFFFLALGIIGAFLPLVPTTPFLLLSISCFSRGSEHFRDWILHHPKLGPPVKNWEENRVISPSAKIAALSLMSVSFSFPLFIIPIDLIFRLIALVTFICVSLFIGSQKNHAQDNAPWYKRLSIGNYLKKQKTSENIS